MPVVSSADRSGQDIWLFVLLAVLYSMLISGLLWLAPQFGDFYTLRNTLFLIPALSAMAASLGFGWRRKSAFLLLTLLGYVVLDFVGARIGIWDVVVQMRDGTFGDDLASSAIALGYRLFILGFPVVMLMVFVGNRPQALWTRGPERAKSTR